MFGPFVKGLFVAVFRLLIAVACPVARAGL